MSKRQNVVFEGVSPSVTITIRKGFFTMNNQKIRTTYTISLVILDALLIGVAFILAYQLRTSIPWPDELANPIPIAGYTGLILVQIVSIIAVLFFYRQYYIPRAVSRVDQFYYIFAAVSIGTLMAVAVSTFIFKGNEVIRDYPRAMVIYAWVLTIVLLLIGRVFHQIIRASLRRRYGIGEDKLLVVGTGDMAQVVVQRILWSPQLGYKLIGIVNGDDKKDLLGVPVLGKPEDLPTLITDYIATNYPTATIERAKYEENEKYVVGVLLEDGTKKLLVFDVDGNFLFERDKKH